MEVESEKKVYTVSIAGMPMKLRSSHDEDTVQRLAQFVSDKISEAMASGPAVSFQSALLLAALHLAEDIMLLKSTASSELSAIEGQARKILTDLETSPVSRVRLDN